MDKSYWSGCSNSTPAETLAHRRSRNRDGAVDSAFVTMVLEIEQEKLMQQAKKAKLIVSKAGRHKEINRTNLTWERMEAGLQMQVVREQLKLLNMRNTHPAFDRRKLEKSF